MEFMVRIRIFFLGLLSLPLWAQTPEIAGSSGGVFSSITRNYRPHPVRGISFEDSPRLEKLIRAGQIYLSLRDAIALAIENNLDLENARINPKLSDANLLRASAGQLLRNVSSSINNGPSSASLGVLSGANSLGTTGGGGSASQGGVLSGLNVQLAGSSIPNLDPVLFGNWQFAHITSPQSSSFVTGLNALVSQYQNAVAGVQKGFLSGTTVSMNLTNTLGLKQNSPQNDFNPITNAALQLQVTQNLLQGFGYAANGRAIRVAKNQRHVSDLTFKEQVISTVTNVANLYWDLVSFNENLRVKREALELNQRLFTDNRRRAELGAIAEIDLIQSQAELKSAQQDVTNAETQVRQQEMTLKSVLTRGGFDNLAVLTARIVPTTPIAIPQQEPVTPIQDLIGEAIRNRPEVEQSQVGLENSRVNMLGTKNALLPTLQAFVNLQNNGQAGDVNGIPASVSVNGIPQRVLRTPGSVNPYFLGGYGTAIGQVFGRNFPNYTVGLQLSMSLRNRAAQADLITDELNYRQSQIQDRQLLNNIKLNVANNWVVVSQARSAYDTSIQARELQEQTLAGATRKYELGTSTFLDVLIVQRDTVTRRLTEIDARNQYIRARTTLQQVTGRILSEYDVDVLDAVNGTVRREADPLPVLEQRP